MCEFSLSTGNVCLNSHRALQNPSVSRAVEACCSKSRLHSIHIMSLLLRHFRRLDDCVFGDLPGIRYVILERNPAPKLICAQHPSDLRRSSSPYRHQNEQEELDQTLSGIPKTGQTPRPTIVCKRWSISGSRASISPQYRRCGVRGSARLKIRA